MFEINSYILQKLGWTKYYQSYGLGPSLANLFNDDNLVRFFLVDSERNFCFLIKELSTDEKQKTKNSYKFIRFDIPGDIKKTNLKKLNFVIDYFNSNQQMIRLLIDNESAGEEYKRHFKISKLLKK
jgi:hypothetical protein